jgi:hypothetical protein
MGISEVSKSKNYHSVIEHLKRMRDLPLNGKCQLLTGNSSAHKIGACAESINTGPEIYILHNSQPLLLILIRTDVNCTAAGNSVDVTGCVRPEINLSVALVDHVFAGCIQDLH